MVLIFFEVITGLKINVGKSEIVPIGDIGNLNALARVLRCKVGSLLMTYLGMPLEAHLEHSQWEIVSHPILQSQKVTLLIIPYHFTTHPTSQFSFSYSTH